MTAYAPNALPRPFPFSGPDELVRFDTDNPSAYEVVGSMGVNNIGFGGMEFDADGNLWAYASLYKDTGGAASGLYTVDTASGQATLVGNSYQSLDDLAYNPADGKMYGIRSQGADMRLYSINLATGATTHEGNFTGMPSTPRAIGLAIDSDGNYYIHDNNVDIIYKSNGWAMSELVLAAPRTLPIRRAMTIDWSRDDTGYHAAVGQGVYPDYFSQINTFATDGSSYVLGPDFGPNEYFAGSAYGFPPVEPGRHRDRAGSRADLSAPHLYPGAWPPPLAPSSLLIQSARSLGLAFCMRSRFGHEIMIAGKGLVRVQCRRRGRPTL